MTNFDIYQSSNPVLWSYFLFVLIIILSQISIMVSATNWYKTLNKPAFQPPAWVFTVVWTIIYILLIYTMYRATGRARSSSQWAILYFSFIFNIFLNLLWTSIFFGAHNIKGGVGIIILLILSTIELMIVVYTIEPVLILFLLPYLIWLFVALYLNYSIMKINT